MIERRVAYEEKEREKEGGERGKRGKGVGEEEMGRESEKGLLKKR